MDIIDKFIFVDQDINLITMLLNIIIKYYYFINILRIKYSDIKTDK